MPRLPLPSSVPLPLPIDPHLEAIVRHVRTARAAVVVAAPGAGKTTRVPPALAADGPVIVLQPRRVAARAIAWRIADEQTWTLGDEVGWHVRFERRFSARTRVLLATEGILTGRLLQDPLLSDFRTIVLDEFHERSLHADVGLALARQAWRARDDLRIVVMSATIDPAPVARFLDDCPVIDVPGREHPVEIAYLPGEPLARAVERLLPRSTGTILCFLPGAPEIRREMTAIARARPDLELLPLHGSLTAEEQDFAIRAPAPARAWSPAAAPPARPAAGPAVPAPEPPGVAPVGTPAMPPIVAPVATTTDRRRVILATNIAETSLTVPGVTAVIDTGLHKVARYDAARGIDSLELERISQDAADQRAGRAGRLGPGVAWRLWDARDRLRPQREPDITRVDLAATLLDLLAWGGDPDRFEWYDTPPRAALDAAWALLRRLGAVEGGMLGERSVDPKTPGAGAASRSLTARSLTARSLTAIGHTLQRLPLHPRLGRILLAAGGARDAARACALLAERHYIAPRHEATTCDLLAAIDRWQDAPPHVQRVARELEQLASRVRRAQAGPPALSEQKSGAGARHRTDGRHARDTDRAGERHDPVAGETARGRVRGAPPAASRTARPHARVAEPSLSSQRRQPESRGPGSHAPDSREAAFWEQGSWKPGSWEPGSREARSWDAESWEAGSREAESHVPETQGARLSESALRRAIFEGYPDRLARRRAPGSPRAVLSSGHGATLSAESGVQEGEFFVALDVQAAQTRDGSREVTEARIRIASIVDRAWLTPTARVLVHWFDADAGRVRAARRDRYDEIVLAEHPVEPDPDAAAPVLAEAYLARGLRDADRQVLWRLQFAGRPIDAAALVARAARTARGLDDLRIDAQLTHEESRDLARLAPDTLRVPSGRSARLAYHEDGSVSAAVKLQELFGLAETPRVGPRQTPVTLQLLAPNGRPVQTTRDLRSFWDRTYPDVRKELRGRYPKHPWPDDPWTAPPTARTTRQR